MSITVYPRYSPRIIIVRAPDTQYSIQDLHNDCKDWEQEPASHSYPSLLATTGKQDLLGGGQVGLTMRLNNAVAGFEQRHTQKSSGTITTGDSNGKTLIDSAGDFINENVVPGDWIVNFTDQSWSTVLSVESATELLCFGLGSGTNNQFNLNDSYKVLGTTQCNFTGGNLTAVDSGGSAISPLIPTSLVNLILAADTTASLIAGTDLDQMLEPMWTVKQSLRMILASSCAKLKQHGDPVTRVVIRDINDSKDRMDATVDEGDRTAIVYDKD